MISHWSGAVYYKNLSGHVKKKNSTAKEKRDCPQPNVVLIPNSQRATQTEKRWSTGNDVSVFVPWVAFFCVLKTAE